MKFFNIQDTREFYERVLRCSGEIHEVTENGGERDLRAAAEYLINTGIAERMKSIGEIDLRIQKPADLHILFSYAMGLGRERICA